MKGARLGGLLARGLIGGATAVIVVIAALLTWPWTVAGPSADERRVEDLQRLTHAVEAFRSRQHILPASLVRLPMEPAAPVHTYDPVTNRPYEYRPLGPLAYELCARFDAPVPEARRDFWWHDAGRYCYSLETREDPKRPTAASADPAAHAPAETPEPDTSIAAPSQTNPESSASPAPTPAPSAPPPDSPAPGGAAAPPGSELKQR